MMKAKIVFWKKHNKWIIYIEKLKLRLSIFSLYFGQKKGVVSILFISIIPEFPLSHFRILHSSPFLASGRKRRDVTPYYPLSEAHLFHNFFFHLRVKLSLNLTSYYILPLVQSSSPKNWSWWFSYEYFANEILRGGGIWVCLLAPWNEQSVWSSQWMRYPHRLFQESKIFPTSSSYSFAQVRGTSQEGYSGKQEW